jgi:MFS family permease
MNDELPPLPHGHTPGSARAAMAYRDYRLIWSGLFFSNIGTWMQNLALPAYVDHRTGSAQVVSLLVFAQLGPILLLAVPGGLIADRFDRKRWLMGMQWVQLVFALVIAALVASDGPIWSLFVAQAAVGVANALNNPAFQATIPMLVDKRDLAGAISMNSMQLNGTRVLGPSIAALLTIVGVSTASLFVINAATYLVLIVALTMVTLPAVRTLDHDQGWRRLFTGVNIARDRPVLSRLLLSMTSFSFFSLVVVALFPSVTRESMGVDPEGSTYRWIYAVFGTGAFAGAAAAGTFLTKVHRPKVISASFVGFGISLAIFGSIESPGPAFPAGFALGTFYFLLATVMATVFQQNLRDEERVTVMPLWFMSFGGTITIGGLVAGPVIDAIGARWVLMIGAAYAFFLAWWCDLDRLPRWAFLRET